MERLLGKRSANALAKLGLKTVQDLVYHIPFRLARRGELMPISQVREGDSVTVVAQVLSTKLRPMNARRGFILNVRIADGLNEMSLTFFGKNSRPLQYHERRLEPGVIATFSGTISSYRGELQLSHPEYELVEEEPDIAKIERPIPIYHAGEKVPSWQIEKAVATVLPSLGEADFPDPLPAGYREAHGLPSLFEAITTLHQPEDSQSWERAGQRMKHEEAFVLQSALALRAHEAREKVTGAYPRRESGLLEAFDRRLPYRLTDGQQEVGKEISREVSRTAPMQRLLQGDVGSGKTVVALRAMAQVVDAGGQAVLLAPTEVLAWQHLRTIEDLLGSLAQGGQIGAPEEATRVDILTGSLTARQRRETLARIASGQTGLIVGTHALLSDDVQIPFLGLAVIDEQHRFGVDQRDRLAAGVHTLVMTATPIPRTIAMSVFGDLDVSVLRELPAGRAGISTTLVPAAKEAWVERVWERAREEIDAGGRVYVVCPRIDDDESASRADTGDDPDSTVSMEAGGDAPALLDIGDFSGAANGAGPSGSSAPLAAVLNVAEQLRAKPVFEGIEIGLMHGRLRPEDKTSAMEAFASGKTPLLVSTTVIEVGVDVPDATLMVILDAERFGFSQLHQLRGRVGRGSKPGLCLAVTRASDGTLAKERLEAFAATSDGFELAEADLRLRSEGDVLGASQSGGASHLRFLSVANDLPIIETARTAARALIDEDSSLSSHPALAAAVATLDAGRAEYLEKG
ncbi:ATP-dependent DNA helicase RecG [Actinomycetaceae bacterium L2_0104]